MTTVAQLISLGIRPPAPDFIVSNGTQFHDLIVAQGATGLSGKTVQLDPGDYGPTIIKDLVNFAPASRVIFRAQTSGGTLVPGFALAGAANITFRGLEMYRTRANDTDATYHDAVNVMQGTVAGSTNITFTDCEIHSDAMSGVDFTGYATVSGGSGTFIDGEPVSTNHGGTGVYRANRPNSTASRFAITAIRTLAASPLTVTSGSALVVVTDRNHVMQNGCSVTIRGATAVGGITPNGTFTATYIDINTWSYTFSSPAASTATGGGSAVRIAPDDMSGNRNGGAVSSSGAWRPGVSVITGETSRATRTFGANYSPQTSSALLDGIGPNSNLLRSDGLTVQDCYLHDVNWPVNICGRDITVSGNSMEDCYQSFCNLNGDISNFLVRANRGINVWAVDTDGQCSGTLGPHSSLFGFSQQGWNTTGGLAEGNVFAVGARRALSRGGQGFATGPKMNDMPNPLVGPSPTFLPGGQIDPDGSHPGFGILTVTQAGGATSSKPMGVLDTNPLASVVNGQRVTGAVNGTPNPLVTDCTIVKQLTSTEPGGTQGMRGTYQVSVSQTVALTTLTVIATYNGISFKSNLFVCNGAQGIQYFAAINGEVAYNTFVTDPTTNAQANTPTLNYGDLLTNSVAHHNAVCGFAGPAGGDDSGQPVSLTWWAGGYDNVCMTPDGAGPGKRSSLFAGPTFTFDEDTTVDDVIAMFATKAGGRLHDGHVGHDAYYDFATNISSYPTYVKPVTTTASGFNLPKVVFTPTPNYTRCSRGAAPTLFGTASFISQATFIWSIAFNVADTVDMNPFLATTNQWGARRMGTASNANNVLRFIADGQTGVATMFQIESSIPLNAAAQYAGADGLTLVVLSLDLPNYRYFLQVGSVIDPFPLVTTWDDTATPMTASNMTLAAGTTGSPTSQAITVGQFLFHDAALDLSSVSVQNALVGLDKRSVDFGSDGSGPFGAQPRAYLRGAAGDAATAGTWNYSGGLNLGSSTQKFIMTGAVTDG